MPLSDHEQRILAELEESLVRQDPEFAERVRSETVYRHAGRYCKWAAVTFVLGVVILVAFYSKSVDRRLRRRRDHVRLRRLVRAQPAPHGPGGVARPDAVEGRGVQSRRARRTGSRARSATPATGSAPASTGARAEHRRGAAAGPADAADAMAVAFPCRGNDPPVADLALAVDIGGTKMAAGLVALDGSLVERAMRPTRRSRPSGRRTTAEALWDDLAGLVREVTAAVRPGDRLVVCGAGCGGPMSPGGEEVSPLNIAGWRSFPLRARLAELTGLPTFVDNDAKALALGEGWVGAAAGCDDYIAMVVSTGVGGGIVLDGRLLDGRLGNAGHIGHVVVVPDGRHCAVRQPGLPRGGGVGHGAGRHDRSAGAAGPAGMGGAHRHARRPRHRVGGEPARPAARRRERIGGAGLRRALLRGRPRRRWTSCAGSSSPGGRGWCPVAWATAARWSGPPGSGCWRGGRRGASGVTTGGAGAGTPGSCSGPSRPIPGLWWASAGALRRMARRGWWHRAPFLPLPGRGLLALPPRHGLRRGRRTPGS